MTGFSTALRAATRTGSPRPRKAFGPQAHKKERAGRTTARQTGGLRQVPPPRERPQLKTDSRGGVATRVPIQYATDMPKKPPRAHWMLDASPVMSGETGSDTVITLTTARRDQQISLGGWQLHTAGTQLLAARCNSYVRARRRREKNSGPAEHGGGLAGYGACCDASTQLRICPELDKPHQIAVSMPR
jgi:hypothetical protein